MNFDMNNYSFLKVFEYIDADNQTGNPALKLCCSLLRNMFIQENYISQEDFNDMVHYQRDEYRLNRIIKRTEKSNTYDTNDFFDYLRTNVFYTDIDKTEKYFFELMLNKIKENRLIISQNLYKVKNVIDSFINCEKSNITDNPAFSEKAQKIIKAFNKKNELYICLMWILVISIYEKNPKENNRIEDHTENMLNYWNSSPIINEALKVLEEDLPSEKETLEEELPSERTETRIDSLVLEGVKKFIESIIDEDLNPTTTQINNCIENRLPFFEKLNIDVNLAKEQTVFQDEVYKLTDLLQNNHNYTKALKLFLIFPKYALNVQALKEFAIEETVKSMKSKGIIVKNNELYQLEYSYIILLEYMRKVSNDFQSDFNKFSCLSYKYSKKEWKNILNIIFLAIDENKNHKFSHAQREHIFKTINFDGYGYTKNTYKNSLERDR